MRGFFFHNQVIKLWNLLPSDVTECQALLKSRKELGFIRPKIMILSTVALDKVDNISDCCPYTLMQISHIFLRLAGCFI